MSLVAAQTLTVRTWVARPNNSLSLSARNWVFLISDYAGDKAMFIKDEESYRHMRFESARRRVAWSSSARSSPAAP